MERFGRGLVLLAFVAGMAAGRICAQAPPTIPVSGNLTQILGSPAAYAGMKIQLYNCPTPASVPGYNVIVQTALLVQANAQGLVNSAIIPNDKIDCSGTTGTSMYAVTYIVQGTPSGTTQCYQLASTQGQWNLNTQQPITCSQAPPNPQDGQFNNLNVTGCLSVDGSGCQGVSVSYLHGTCDGVTDDTTLIQNAVNAVHALVVAGGNASGSYGPAVLDFTCASGKKERFSSTINIPNDVLVYNLNLWELPAIGAQTAVRFYSPLGYAGGLWFNGNIQGCGQGCTGTGIELYQVVGMSFEGTNTISEFGGHAMVLYDSERTNIGCGTEFFSNAQAFLSFESNEVHDCSKTLFNGSTDYTNGVAGKYVFSPNCPNGTCPTSGTVQPIGFWAAKIVDDAYVYHLDGPGSIKGSAFDQPQFMCSNTILCDLEDVYLEQSDLSVSAMSGAPVAYALTTAAMTTSQTTVAVSTTSYVYNYHGSVVASWPTFLAQRQWVDSCTDAQNANGSGAGMVIYPPDYSPGSTAASSLGGGIEKGMYADYYQRAYCGTPTSNSLVLGSATPYAGCSNPPSCSAHAAIAWPAGAATGELQQSATLKIASSHVSGFTAQPMGYPGPYAIEPSDAAIPAELSVGAPPDPYQIPEGGFVLGASWGLILENDDMNTDATAGGVRNNKGLIFALNQSTVDVSQQVLGDIPETNADTPCTVTFLEAFYIFGPSQIRCAGYDNGQFASLVVHMADGDRQISSDQGVQAADIAAYDPTLGVNIPGKTCLGGCATYSQPAVPAQSTPTVNGAGGSIAPGPQGQSIGVSERWVQATPWPASSQGVLSGNYTNATISNGGSNWVVPASTGQIPAIVNVAGASGDTAAYTSVATTTSTATFCGFSSIPASWATSTGVTVSGNTATAVDQGMNAHTYAYVSQTASPNCVTLSTPAQTAQSSTSDAGSLTLSRCPYFYAKASDGGTGTKVLSVVLGDAGSNPAVCEDAPGTSETLNFSQVVGATGSGASGTLVVQGSYTQANQPLFVRVTSGTASSITVPSPPADPSGTALFWQVGYGPQPMLYQGGIAAIGTSQTITAVTYAPLYPTQLLWQNDCTALCGPTYRQWLDASGNFSLSAANALTGVWTPYAKISGAGQLTLPYYATTNAANLLGVNSAGVVGLYSGSGGGTGTVTSVGLTVPSWLTVNGSPITLSGTLAVTGASEPANLVLASPSGTAGAMTPTALTVPYLPSIVQTGGFVPDAGACRLTSYASSHSFCPATFEIIAAIKAAIAACPTASLYTNSSGSSLTYSTCKIVIDPTGSPYTGSSEVVIPPNVQLDGQNSEIRCNTSAVSNCLVEAGVYQPGGTAYYAVPGGIRDLTLRTVDSAGTPNLSPVYQNNSNPTVETYMNTPTGTTPSTNGYGTCFWPYGSCNTATRGNSVGLFIGGDLTGTITGNPGSNWGQGYTNENLTIIGFGVGVEYGNTTWGNTWINVDLNHNYYGLLSTAYSASGCGSPYGSSCIIDNSEVDSWFSSRFDNNVHGVGDWGGQQWDFVSSHGDYNKSYTYGTGILSSVTGVGGGSGFSGSGTILLSGFNNGCSGATATVTLASGGFASAVVTGAGTGCTAAPTTATCTSGTATCTGSPVSITVSSTYLSGTYELCGGVDYGTSAAVCGSSIQVGGKAAHINWTDGWLEDWLNPHVQIVGSTNSLVNINGSYIRTASSAPDNPEQMYEAMSDPSSGSNTLIMKDNVFNSSKAVTDYVNQGTHQSSMIFNVDNPTFISTSSKPTNWLATYPILGMKYAFGNYFWDGLHTFKPAWITATNTPAWYLDCQGATEPSFSTQEGLVVNSCGASGHLFSFWSNGTLEADVNNGGTAYFNSKLESGSGFFNSNSNPFAWTSSASSAGTVDTVLARLGIAGVVGVQSAATPTNSVAGSNGMLAGTFEAGGATFTAAITSGTCTLGTPVGGATAGTVPLTLGGAVCTMLVTFGSVPAPANAWMCATNDRTTTAANTAGFHHIGSTSTTATFQLGTQALTNDNLDFRCEAY